MRTFAPRPTGGCPVVPSTRHHAGRSGASSRAGCRHPGTFENHTPCPHAASRGADEASRDAHSAPPGLRRSTSRRLWNRAGSPVQSALQVGFRGDPRSGGACSQHDLDRLDSAPSLSPPFCRKARGIQRSTRPVQFPGLLQLVQQQPVDAIPDPKLVPALQPSPAGHPAAAAHLLWQELPLDARLQHEQDAPERVSIRHTRPSRP